MEYSKGNLPTPECVVVGTWNKRWSLCGSTLMVVLKTYRHALTLFQFETKHVFIWEWIIPSTTLCLSIYQAITGDSERSWDAVFSDKPACGDLSSDPITIKSSTKVHILFVWYCISIQVIQIVNWVEYVGFMIYRSRMNLLPERTADSTQHRMVSPETPRPFFPLLLFWTHIRKRSPDHDLRCKESERISAILQYPPTLFF